MSYPLPAASRMVFVTKGGVDALADGTPLKPFLTIQAAAASITAASASNPFILLVGPGYFTESAFALPDYVTIAGAGRTTTFIDIPSNFGSSLGNIHTIGLRDLALVNGAQMADATSSTSNSWIEFENVDLGDVRLGQNNYRIRFQNCRGGNLDVRTCNDGYGRPSQFINSTFNGLERFSEGAGSYADFRQCSFGAAKIRAATYAATWSFYNTTCASLENVAGNPTINLYGSDIGVLTITAGAPVINNFSNSYIPSDPADWTGAAPTQLQDAIDRLAAATPGA